MPTVPRDSRPSLYTGDKPSDTDYMMALSVMDSMGRVKPEEELPQNLPPEPLAGRTGIEQTTSGQEQTKPDEIEFPSGKGGTEKEPAPQETTPKDIMDKLLELQDIIQDITTTKKVESIKDLIKEALKVWGKGEFKEGRRQLPGTTDVDETVARERAGKSYYR